MVFDQGPQFFEIYLPEYSSRQLIITLLEYPVIKCIPPAFIKHFNGQIPDKFILKDRGGKSWNVDMQKANNGLFIRNGWQAFISGNSVKAGDFLVFRYNGSLSFTVKIFGKNGCKKEEAPAFVKTDVHVKIEPDSDGEVEQTARQRSCTRKYSKVALKNPQKLRGTKFKALLYLKII
ncbi:hypothetical protein RJ640_012178 [Escallonia rubra]|uniref:TF-B3 domain-containing protein n=1 Tax=Escallonia rubra TaxID=112253 RepID=A0AA88R1F0_9ASTE|nr:hypothetical protein RJ640_012178 [Escallonia rubra]